MPAPLQQSWPRLGAEARGRIRVADPRRSSWLVLHRPLRKIWVRHLGWWHSQYIEKMFQITNQTSFFCFPYFFLWTWSLAGPECKKDTKVDGNLVVCFWFVTIFYFSQFSQHTNRPQKKRCSTLKKVGATTGALLAGASDGHILRSK